MATDTAQPTDERIPEYCGLDEEDLEQRVEGAIEMMQRVTRIEETEDGYCFTFPGDQETLELVTAFGLEERRCCPMGTFEIRFGGDEDPVQLIFQGPEGMKEDIRGGMRLEEWVDTIHTPSQEA